MLIKTRERESNNLPRKETISTADVSAQAAIDEARVAAKEAKQAIAEQRSAISLMPDGPYIDKVGLLAELDGEEKDAEALEARTVFRRRSPDRKT